MILIFLDHRANRLRQEKRTDRSNNLIKRNTHLLPTSPIVSSFALPDRLLCPAAAIYNHKDIEVESKKKKKKKKQLRGSEN